MRRALFLSFMVLAGCSPKGPSGPAAGVFAGAGKDRLCIAGETGALRAGLISYAADGAANCSLAGKLETKGAGFVLRPTGEGACEVALEIVGDKASIGTVPAACRYYCGPDVSLSGKRFTRDPKGAPAVDVAGDPLC